MKDLLKLYSFESVHNTPEETAIADWICKWLDYHKIVGYKRKGNNIYRLGYESDVILSAHLDQVKTNGKAVRFFQNAEGHIAAFNSKWQRTSLGADDKNGIWIILKALESSYAKETLNFIISAGEEIGCVGIKALEDAKVLESIDSSSQFCLVLDRKGNTDVLKGGGSTTYCSTLAQTLVNFWQSDYEVTTGGLSDTATICKYCESINLSVAYSDPHHSTETTDFNRLVKIKDDVLKVINDMIFYPTDPDVYSKHTSSVTSSYRKYYGGIY